jgi:hypothetical protein
MMIQDARIVESFSIFEAGAARFNFTFYLTGPQDLGSIDGYV